MNSDRPFSATDGNAIVFCEGAFDTTYGKTAHGLVRFTRRYRVMSVVDSLCAGHDAGMRLDGEAVGVPIHASMAAAIADCDDRQAAATHMVVGLATDGGKLTAEARRAVIEALEAGLNVDSGLHEWLSDDPQLVDLAARRGAVIRDVRKPPPRSRLHFFSGCIAKVDALKVAVLGTDSAVGKRTTAWRIVQGLEARGVAAELIGTGQTAWMQGARYGILLDSLINDFVTGEIEHAVCLAWEARRPQVIVIEGQGSLMNPAYPGGFEILAAGRPDTVILQHAPARRVYDGFPDHEIHPLPQQIQAIELLSGKRVAAVTINHEGLSEDRIAPFCSAIESTTALPTVDVLKEGADRIVDLLISRLETKGRL